MASSSPQIVLMYACVMMMLTVDVVSSTNEKYRGHQVVQLMAGGINSADMMRKLIEHELAMRKVDVWAEGPDLFQIQVDPKEAQMLKHECEKRNITMQVMIPDVKEAIDKELRTNEDNDHALETPSHPLLRRRKRKRRRCFHYNKFNRYDDIVKEIYRLKCRYRSIMDVVEVGQSYEKRKLLLVKIGEDITNDCTKNKKIVWIDGGTHAREWISVASAMYMMKELVRNYGKQENITNFLKNNTVFIAPVINPDGYEYTFTDDRLWRKSRTPNPGSECVGTDPNRNWDVMWGGKGTSKNPCDDSYGGTHAESEPVIKTYATVLRYIQKRIKAFWSFHSYSQVFLFPNSYSNERPADRGKMELSAIAFFREAMKRHGKVYAPGTTIERLKQTLTGVSIDYMHDKLGVTYSFLLELRPSIGVSEEQGFLLSADQIIPTSQECFDAILKTMEMVDMLEAS